MEKIVSKLQPLLPDVTFTCGSSFFWSPKHRQITYRDDQDNVIVHTWALLHETAHALLGHCSYQSDFELLVLEVEAWDKACEISKEVGVKINEDHIQDCLDTYRDWIHQRSTCPTCGTVSFQRSAREYRCHNCHSIWTVSSSRFCRPYRLHNGRLSDKKTMADSIITPAEFQ
jgi:hypothetical protein